MSGVELDTGRTLPAWAVRLGPAAAAVAAEALAHPPGMARWVLAGWLGVSAVLLGGSPGGLAAGGVLVTTGLALLSRPVTGWRTALLVLLLHAVVVLAPLAAHASWRAVVEVAVLGRLMRDALVAQVVAQLLALAALPGALGGAHPWLRVVALAATVTFAAAAGRRTTAVP
ncbi:hypothetical protein CLV35_1973 [Motilibacter peucedani]|uniref:Uncharacterized protein n=1 Tax=Motilibacter peucedani TaxID=598650 RepID=A0A420XQE1_9ACTN|nr:hypothetical protein [Motilibacter peucedani]RKS75503.1 hypothetical protein CLV35_1973 [Motilibacter peucedani]